MGSLHRFDIEKYRSFYGLDAFFETGTFQGSGVQCAIGAGFPRIFSAEIVDEYYELNVERFRGLDNVTILKGDSVHALSQTLPDVEENILFWLDAHFPGADGGLADHNQEQNERIRCPLESELETIKRLRPAREDLFLIDDLRVYEGGPFANGDLPAFIARPARNGIEFVYRLFGDSHHIVKLFYDEGYLLMLPISDVPKLFVQRRYDEVSGGVTQSRTIQ